MDFGVKTGLVETVRCMATMADRSITVKVQVLDHRNNHVIGEYDGHKLTVPRLLFGTDREGGKRSLRRPFPRAAVPRGHRCSPCIRSLPGAACSNKAKELGGHCAHICRIQPFLRHILGAFNNGGRVTEINCSAMIRQCWT
jgi:hypothetical protein